MVPRVLLVYAMAVMIEVAGLIVEEVEYSKKGKKSFPRICFISAEAIAAAMLLFIAITGITSDWTVIEIGNIIFNHIIDPIVIFSMPLSLYVCIFWMPCICAIVWVFYTTTLLAINAIRSFLNV